MKNKKIKYVVGILILLCTGVLVYFLYDKVYLEYKAVPHLKMKGDKQITILFGDNYLEPGYFATVRGSNVTDKVKVEGQVNLKKVGTYKLVYSVENRKGKNKVSVTRKVTIVDKENPTLTLTGEATVQLYVGDSYKEPGYKALDNYDGDITSQVKVSGTVDTKKAGTYELTYQVMDTSKNSSEAKRKIVVKEKPQPVTSYSQVGSGLPILMYHFFYDQSKGETGVDANYTEIHNFEAQVKYLKEQNYYFPTWSEVKSYVEGKISLPQKSIVITADDGNATFFKYAVPIIDKYGVKATSFVITSWVDPKTLRISPNVFLESHSHNMHQGGCNTGAGGLFQCIDYEKGKNDLLTSKKLLGSSAAFCYPFGDVNEREKQLLKETGYSLALTTQYGKVYPYMDLYELPRIRISKGDDINSFIAKIR